jgi:hypothetical protein
VAAVTIIDKREIPSGDPGRVGKFDAMITYQLDDFRVYFVTLPNEDLGKPNEQQIIAEAIKKDLADRERFSGMKLEV